MKPVKAPLWCIFLSLSVHVQFISSVLYARTFLPPEKWPLYVYRKSAFEVTTRIECGAICETDDNCNGFIWQNFYCHKCNVLGQYEIIESQSEEAPIYIKTPTLRHNLATQFGNLTEITSDLWQDFIHSYEDVHSNSTIPELECYMKCISLGANCHFFAYEEPGR